jgi:heterotetrameric sarcosine oxidase gamma subunit
MAERASPLRGLVDPRVDGHVGAAGPGLRLSTRTDLVLWQAAAWPDTIGAVEAMLAERAGAVPSGFGRVAVGPGGAVVRVSPLEWWVFDGGPLALPAEAGSVLDLSHGWTPVRLEGRDAAALLARLVAVDLRDRAFPVGGFAATGGHHLMLKLWRREAAVWELFAMRSFAGALWAHLLEHARPFGVEIA